MKVRFGMLLLLLCLLYGCGKEEEPTKNSVKSEKESIEIGIIFDTFVIERWQGDRDVFVSTAKELGATVDVQNANGDAKKQLEQMNYFIDKKVDVIVVVPIDGTGLGDAVKRAKNAGIKVISYDRLVTNANTDLYISFDNEEVGRLMGEAIHDQIGIGGNVLMLCGPMSDNNVSLVNKGFLNVMDTNGLAIWDTFYTDGWNEEYALGYLQEKGDDITKVQAIMCGNDNLAGQVIYTLAEYQLAGDICVVGQDADLDACQRIIEGTQYMTVYKPVDMLAAQAAEAAVKLAKGEALDTSDVISDGSNTIPYIKLQPIAVTKENMDEVIIDSGFHQKEDVYLNRPELMDQK